MSFVIKAQKITCEVFRLIVTTRMPSEKNFEAMAALLGHMRTCPHCEEWIGEGARKEHLRSPEEAARADARGVQAGKEFIAAAKARQA